MLRHIVGGIVVGLAAYLIGDLPAVRPHVSDGKQRFARLLDRASLSLEGNTALGRQLVAGMEPIATFPEAGMLRRIGRSVGLLWVDVIDGKGGESTWQCTATLIAPSLLITNHHCFKTNSASDQLQIQVWLDYRGGTPARHKIDAAPIEVDASLDFALLRLLPNSSAAQPEPLTRPLFRAAQPGERLFLLHHADSKPMQVTRTRCRVATSINSGKDELRHTCATLPGSSGALVFAEQDNAVVGLHRARRRGDDRTPGVATPVTALLAKSATLRRLAPAGLAQTAAR